VCLSSVYVAEGQGMSLLMEEVAWVGVEGQRVRIRGAAGEQRSIAGRLCEVDFAADRTVIEPVSPLPGSLEELIRQAELFHGHLGPFLVIGLRMGVVARRLLGFGGHFDVRVTAFTGRETPVPCIVDGLQFSTGATLGKGNIEVVEMPDACPAARIETDGRAVKVSLRRPVLQEVQSRLETGAGERVAAHVAHLSESDLFEIEERV
jgi:formylmethanofuran dehydrogenase subunit E